MAHISNTTPPCVLGSFVMSTRKTKEALLQEPDVSKTGNPTKYTPRPHDEMKPNTFEFFGSELPVSSETLKQSPRLVPNTLLMTLFKV